MLHPIKGLALLFFQEEKAYSGEERDVEQISFFLSMNPNNAFQQSLGFRSNKISPKPVINRMLFDETMNGATIRSEIGSVSIRVSKE